MSSECGGLSCPTFHKINGSHAKGLAGLFDALRDNGDEHFFHPHPLTFDEAGRIAVYKGKDFYAVMQCEGSLVGYGMLRGWDEGYLIPSLGLALHPEVRGMGFGKRFINFLHQEAKKRQAVKVRLTVDRANGSALHLYLNAGYVFAQGDNLTLEGSVTL